MITITDILKYATLCYHHYHYDICIISGCKLCPYNDSCLILRDSINNMWLGGEYH